MGQRTSHPPGTFSWADLGTPDRHAASAFYSGLFGWRLDDIGDWPGDAVFRIGDDAVVGLADHTVDQRAAGAPAAWTNHVTVGLADAVGERAVELGGVIVAEPFDVGDGGRAALLADPQGARFAVWEPRGRIGAERVNDVGCMTMNELATDDTGAARAFYESLFGWATTVVDTGPGGPLIVGVQNDGRLNGTMSVAVGVPPHWRPYFTVDSTDTSAARVRDLGGTVAFGPVPAGGGSIAVVLDPQGAVFGLFAGHTDE